MKRFENAEVGDLVYSRTMGCGRVFSIRETPLYAQPSERIYIQYSNGFVTACELDGRNSSEETEPTLFYRSSTDNYLTERPEPEVDWANMKKGTSLVSVGYAEETPAYFLSLSGCDHIWIYYKETHTTAYSVHVSRWKPKAKEASCQKA